MFEALQLYGNPVFCKLFQRWGCKDNGDRKEMLSSIKKKIKFEDKDKV